MISVRGFNDIFLTDYALSFLYETKNYDNLTCYLVTTLNPEADVAETNMYIIASEAGERHLERVSMTSEEHDSKYF